MSGKTVGQSAITLLIMIMFEFVTGLIQPGIVHIEGEKITLGPSKFTQSNGEVVLGNKGH